MISEFFEYAAQLYAKAKPNLDLPRSQDCSACGGRGVRMRTPGGGFALNPGNQMQAVRCRACGGSGRTTR